MGGVIFDLDDTLYPRERFVRSGLAATAQYVEREFGIPAERALTTMLKVGGGAPAAEFQTLCDVFMLPHDILPRMLATYRAHVPSLWLFHDAEATLRALRADGWQLALLTNGLPEVQALKVDALGLRALVDHVVFATDHAPGGKPHPAAFQEVLRRLALPADHCVMVGDDVECDVRGARAVGIGAIRIARGIPSAPCEADAVVRFLADVPSAAASLVGKASAHAA
ncbi:MAG: HAD family hydrolase [Vicinamibacterales bacterium]